MKKVVFLSCIPTPHWLRFVPYLRKYVNAKFYYYDTGNHGRPEWWLEELGEHSFVLPKSIKMGHFYFNRRVWATLNKERPDVLIMGGFVDPGNVLAYIWARLHGCKTIIMTERSRTRTGRLQGYNLKWRILRLFYRKLDAILLVASGNGVEEQFVKTLRFGEKVKFSRYPAFLDPYFAHPLRGKKGVYTIIHANGLTTKYNPICSVKAFALAHQKHPNTRLFLNAVGPLRLEVEEEIRKAGIEDSVRFLDGLKTFDDLNKVYAESDIMLLPANFSNGNYTVAEGMASGISILISTKVPCRYAEQMKTAESIFIAEPNPEPFAEEICRLIENPEEMTRIGRVNREIVRPRSMESTARQYAEIVNSL